VRSAQKCKDSIEAVMSDLWHLKEWLQHDPSTGFTKADLHAFLATPQAFHIRACGDLATRDKHYELSARWENTTIRKQEIVDAPGMPIMFTAIRDYGDGNIDNWGDATELAIRAAMEWEAFLAAGGFLPDLTIDRVENR
jgi:hypothetical protein